MKRAINVKRNQKTNYRNRLSLIKSGKPRLVVRVSSKNISAQLIEYQPDSDKVLCTFNSRILVKLGWNASRSNIPAAYLLGYYIGKNKPDSVKDAVLDIGKHQSVKGSRVYALVKGAKDAGLNIPLGDEVVPDESRINGEHIASYGSLLAENDKKKYESVFSSYIKNKIKPEDMNKYFNDTKSKIEGA